MRVKSSNRVAGDVTSSKLVSLDSPRKLEVEGVLRAKTTPGTPKEEVSPEVKETDSEEELISDRGTSTEAPRNKLKRKRGNKSRYCEVSDFASCIIFFLLATPR